MTTYNTNLKIIYDGRAIVADLSDAKLPTERKNPHVTILFHKSGRYPTGTLEKVQKEATTFSGGKPVSFTLKKWGKRSDLIEGRLLEFFMLMKKSFPSLISDRKAHVCLR